MGVMRKRSLVAVLALLAVACGAATSAEAHTLALAYKTGDVQKYTFHSVANEQINTGRTDIPVNVDMSAKETVTVQSVDSAGVAEVSVALTDVTIKTDASGSSNSTKLDIPAQTIKIAADGRILSVNGTTAQGNPFGMGTGGNLSSAIFPNKPVKPGDTWSKDYDQANPFGSGVIHVTTKSKYLNDEKLKGVNTAVVETTSSSDFDFTLDMSALASAGTTPLPLGGSSGIQGITMKGTTTATVTTWIDPSARHILKTHVTSKTNANMNFVLAPGSALAGLLGPMSVKGDQTVDLLPV
jgi:hypothetical protein